VDKPGLRRAVSRGKRFPLRCFRVLPSNRVCRRQAEKRRNQRIAIIIFIIAVIVLIVLFIWQGRPQSTEPSSDLITTSSGLQYQDIIVGNGEIASAGDLVIVHYTGWLEDGNVFDSSLERETPFEFTLGEGRVIAGWEEGITGMQVGGIRKLIIPPELGYGSSGAAGVIPPNATLTFEVELIAIQ